MHCGSKGLTPTQQQYSTIELECLAIVWAIQKCSFYLRGLPLFRVYTDHWPLEGVFQKDIFDLASSRLQRLREKVAMFSFQVCWVPGKTHLVANTMSCAPLFAPEELPDLEIDTAISCKLRTRLLTSFMVRSMMTTVNSSMTSRMKHLSLPNLNL